MGDVLASRSMPEERLRQALAQDELALYCQPIAGPDGTVRFPMAEVLVRLKEEEKAMLPPGDFLPAYEHYRMMPALDRWVVRKVVQHLATHKSIPSFSINLSSQTIEDASFPEAVALKLASAAVPGTALLFEISEADVLDRAELSLRFAAAIHAFGCGLVVGGFGRRAATSMPLKALRPDYVKVDGTIVRKLLTESAADTKLRTIISLSKALSFKIIAEMVEEQDILARLTELGVTYAQGYGIREPHPIELLQG